MGFHTAFRVFPRLETERLLLREITREDRDQFYNLLQADEADKSDDWKPLTRGEAEALILARQEAFRRQRQIRWGIQVSGDPTIIGTIAIHSINAGVSGELGYFLQKEFWGKGLMTEAALAVIQYGFESLELPKIEAVTGTTNWRSVNVLEKLGFSDQGVLKDNILLPTTGGNGGSSLYILSRVDYLSRARDGIGGVKRI